MNPITSLYEKKRDSLRSSPFGSPRPKLASSKPKAKASPKSNDFPISGTPRAKLKLGSAMLSSVHKDKREAARRAIQPTAQSGGPISLDSSDEEEA